MFTGLIQQVGSLAAMTGRGKGKRLAVRHSPWDTPLALGESVAVNGVCLTVAERGAGQFCCDVLEETLDKTGLGRKRPGDPLNLERALRVDDRLGGHMVTGHVDGVGTVTALDRKGDDWTLEVACDAGLLTGMVPKGSIAVDGVSLTLVELSAKTFSVHLIPHTWKNTALHALRKGGTVNLETDIIGKYVARHLANMDAGSGLTVEKLRASFGGMSA